MLTFNTLSFISIINISPTLIPHIFHTPLRYLHKLYYLKTVCINVLYILCIGHLTDVVLERAKQCGAYSNL